MKAIQFKKTGTFTGNDEEIQALFGGHFCYMERVAYRILKCTSSEEVKACRLSLMTGLLTLMGSF